MLPPGQPFRDALRGAQSRPGPVANWRVFQKVRVPRYAPDCGVARVLHVGRVRDALGEEMMGGCVPGGSFVRVPVEVVPVEAGGGRGLVVVREHALVVVGSLPVQVVGVDVPLARIRGWDYGAGAVVGHRRYRGGVFVLAALSYQEK